MARQLTPDDLRMLSPGGHYVALRLGFAFPMEEINHLPQDWVEHYTTQRYMLNDPVIRWIYANTGAIRWSDIQLDDPKRILAQARTFGLRYGLAVSVFDNNPEGQRSFGTFVRGDREFSDDEAAVLTAWVSRRHIEKAPPRNITDAELEALRMVKDGMRLKQIAHSLGVSEGAVKQRLRNAKRKLGAQTGPQAVTLATEFGLI
nr:autoinducer binding domain-containing protein [Histidinibacterium lentulum]